MPKVHPDAPRPLRLAALGVAMTALAACGGDGFDWDLRPASGASTAEAARQATAARPQPDARGVISYPGYQVVVARRGETVGEVATRLGLEPVDLASHNALAVDTQLRDGEVLTLPRRVAARPPTEDRRDVSSIAVSALDRVESPRPAAEPPVAGPEPLRHTVQRGETAFTIARLYNVTPRALADWNGLGADMAVREGQTLMIPVAAPEPVRTAAATPPAPAAPPDRSPPAQRPAEPPAAAAPAEPQTPRPGRGSPTPTPPSAAAPLPTAEPATQPAPAAPPSPNLGEQRTAAASGARLSMPVDGRIIREFQPGRTDGISIAAAAGTPVRAAADGTVATITRDTQQTQIVILRHENNLLTVYANIDDIAVERGQQVRRGQQIGAIQAGDPAFVLFQVRQGIDSVDPMQFLR